VFRTLKRRWRTRVSARSAPKVHRDAIRRDWSEHRYYRQAEDDEWLAPFWAGDSPFRRQVEHLDLACVIEIGCGRGRHSAQIADQAGRLFLVDINPSNIEACTQRFAGRDHVACICNQGGDLSAIANDAATAAFSYDAMVHFEASDVLTYLSELHRVLRPAGRALLHYSNYEDNPGGFYRDNPGHRNFFSERMMRHFADRAGFAVEYHSIFAWPLGAQGYATDGLVLLRK
jgi:SAM-dependent methyltransferase